MKIKLNLGNATKKNTKKSVKPCDTKSLKKNADEKDEERDIELREEPVIAQAASQTRQLRSATTLQPCYQVDIDATTPATIYDDNKTSLSKLEKPRLEQSCAKDVSTLNAIAQSTSLNQTFDLENQPNLNAESEEVKSVNQIPATSHPIKGEEEEKNGEQNHHQQQQHKLASNQIKVVNLSDEIDCKSESSSLSALSEKDALSNQKLAIIKCQSESQQMHTDTSAAGKPHPQQMPTVLERPFTLFMSSSKSKVKRPKVRKVIASLTSETAIMTAESSPANQQQRQQLDANDDDLNTNPDQSNLSFVEIIRRMPKPTAAKKKSALRSQSQQNVGDSSSSANKNANDVAIDSHEAVQQNQKQIEAKKDDNNNNDAEEEEEDQIQYRFNEETNQLEMVTKQAAHKRKRKPIDLMNKAGLLREEIIEETSWPKATIRSFRRPPRRCMQLIQISLPVAPPSKATIENENATSTASLPVAVDGEETVAQCEAKIEGKTVVPYQDLQDSQEKESEREKEAVTLTLGSNSGRWSRDEMVKLYKALATIGTDFETMQKLIPGRSRNEIKRKFKSEEKKNLHLIDRVLKNRRPFDEYLFKAAEEEFLQQAANPESAKMCRVTNENAATHLLRPLFATANPQKDTRLEDSEIACSSEPKRSRKETIQARSERRDNMCEQLQNLVSTYKTGESTS